MEKSIEIKKIILDKILLAIVAFAVLMPLQRCQHINNLKSIEIQKVRQMNIDVLQKSLSNLSTAAAELSSILLRAPLANNSDIITLRDAARINIVKIESTLYTSEAFFVIDKEGAKNTKEKSTANYIRSTIADIHLALGPHEEFKSEDSKLLVVRLQREIAKYLKEIKKNVSAPII